jgi:hypothetical protein
MANPQASTELQHIAKDAVTSASNQGDHQAENRLRMDISNFERLHDNPADYRGMLKTLKGAGLKDDQITNLQNLGFPSPEVFDSNDAANDSPPVRQPNSVNDIVTEVQQVEGNFNRTSAGFGASAAQESLRMALADVQGFSAEHPEQTKQLISELAAGGQLPQLAVAQLDQETRGRSINDTLTRAQAVQLLDDGTPLGKALAQAMDTSFSSTQGDGTTPANYWGRGFADSQNRQTNEPQMSLRHLRTDLMNHFDKAPVNATQDESLWNRFLDFTGL